MQVVDEPGNSTPARFFAGTALLVGKGLLEGEDSGLLPLQAEFGVIFSALNPEAAILAVGSLVRMRLHGVFERIIPMIGVRRFASVGNRAKTASSGNRRRFRVLQGSVQGKRRIVAENDVS